VAAGQKHRAVRCSNDLFMGSRLNTIHPSIPADMMYNHRAPLTLMQNLFGEAKKRARMEEDQQRPHKPAPSSSAKVGGSGDEHRFLPDWPAKLAARRRFARKVLQERYGWKPSRPMFSAVVHADSLWFKYASGYYGWLGKRVAHTLSNSTRTLLPSPKASLAHLQRRSWDLLTAIWNQPYRRVVDATVDSVTLTARVVSDVYSEGTFKVISRTMREYKEYKRAQIKRGMQPRVSRLAEALRWSPLFGGWFAAPGGAANQTSARPSIFAPFISHMKRVIAGYRERWPRESQPWSMWTADLHFWSLRDVLLRRWSHPVWQPGQRENWARVGRLYWSIRHRIWPDEAMPEEHKRFLFDSNCLFADRLVNLTLNTAGYCAAQAVINVRDYNPLTHDPDSPFGYRNMPSRYTLQPSSARPGAWLRPRRITTNESAWKWRKRAADARVYRVATDAGVPMERHGPGGWTLQDWLAWVIENVFGWNFDASRDTWWDAVMNWFKNSNTSNADWPDVGFLYWLRFLFICDFPSSYNCSIGWGFEPTIWYVLAGFFAVVIISGYFFPLLGAPFAVFGYGLSALTIFAALGFGFPITCAIPVPPISVGGGLPECFLDQLFAFLDRYIAPCYVPLIIPSYMVGGDPCPADGKIDFLDCRDIGVSDGITNLLFLGVWLLGAPFVNAALNIMSSALGAIIPGAREYAQLTLTAMQDANPTQMQRLEFCFFATIYTIIPVIFFFVAIGIILFALVPPLLMVIEAIVTLFFALPLVALVPGADQSSWFPWQARGPPQREQQASLPPQPTLVQHYLYGVEELERKKRK